MSPSVIAELNQNAEATLPIVEEDEDVQYMLQSSLSIVEIDKEIERVQQELQLLDQNLTTMKIHIEQQEEQIAAKREQAGKVLVAYYKGERTNLFFSILKSDTLEGLLMALDFLDLIMKQDQKALSAYIEHYDNLKASYDQYEANKIQLELKEVALQEQREHVIALENQIQQKLEGRSDAERILILMQQLNSFWETKGLTEVQTYFKALAEAMNHLPEWLQKNQQYISMKGFKYSIELPDSALNEFLREQDKIFNHLEFVFEENQIVAKGNHDDISINISGNYSIAEDPTNHIKFTVDSLVFNGFVLPQSTVTDLERQFDLNFYPSYIISMLKAKDVQLTDGTLTIELQLKL